MVYNFSLNQSPIVPWAPQVDTANSTSVSSFSLAHGSNQQTNNNLKLNCGTRADLGDRVEGWSPSRGREAVCLSVFSCTVLFVSISQVIGCEDRLRNDVYCVGWGVKLYSNQTKDRQCALNHHDVGRLPLSEVS